MKLLNMTNRAQINEFHKYVKQSKFLYFQVKVLKFGDLLGGGALCDYLNMCVLIYRL